jgi:hypothetical protein
VLLVDGAEVFLRLLRVAGDHAQVGVAEEPLEGDNIHALPEARQSESAPEGVRHRSGDPRGSGATSEQAHEARVAEPSAVPRHPKRVGGSSIGAASQVARDLSQSGSPDEHGPRALPLREAERERAGLEVQVANAQGKELRGSASGVEQAQEERAVAIAGEGSAAAGRQHPAQVLSIQRVERLLMHTRRGDLADRVVPVLRLGLRFPPAQEGPGGPVEAVQPACGPLPSLREQVAAQVSRP